MANLKEMARWEQYIYQIDVSDPVVGGENGVTNRPILQLANRTLYLKKQADYVQALAAPKTITAESGNVVDIAGHSHEIALASTSQAGIVLLNNTLTSSATNQALTAAMGKKLNEEKVSLATAQTITGAKTFSAEITSTSANAMRLKAATRSVMMRFDGNLFYLLKTADGDPSGNWDATRPFTWDLRNNTATLNGNATTATRLQNPRTINGVAFDGTANITVGLPTFGGYINQPDTTLADANIAPTQGGFSVRHLSGSTTNKPSGVSHSMMTCAYDDRYATQLAADWRTNKLYSRTLNNGTWVNWKELAYTDSNVASATKLQTARNIAMTGDGSWNVNFDGSGNVSGTLTLANSGVTAGSYNSVTVDAKGRVTRGLTQTHGLVTATTATGTANVATGNGNTFLNIVASGVGQTASVGSSTQITGTNGITVSSDTAGKLIISQEIANTLTDASASKSLSAAQGKVLNETKLGNTGLQTLTGTLRVESNSWGKLSIPLPDGTNWWQEYNPETKNAEVGAAIVRFLHVDGSVKRYYDFPKSASNEKIAYQSWVQNGFLSKTDNAPTATKLQTARTINGVAFDGTQNIIITDNTKAPATHRHNWNEIDGKPSTFTPSSHTHSIANITDFDIKELGTENLDSITKWGIYGQGANANSLAERNYPVDREAGTLEVLIGTYGLRQRFTTFASHRQFERSRNNTQTGWNAWTELSNTWGAIRGKPSDLAYTSSNVASATKLQTSRNIAMTGDGSWNVNFDGSGNVSGTLTLANSGVTAGSYNSVTVDAKGRVTRGLTQTHGLVTATTATGTANVATGNTNTYLNIVASGVGQTSSVGSSTQVTGTNGISVSSDTAGKLIITRDSNSPTATKLQTARTISLTGAVTGQANFDGSGNVSIPTTLPSVANNVVVMTGEIEHGGTIPLPAGFSEAQCKWFVSISDDNASNRGWDIWESAGHRHYGFKCFTTGRVVTAQTLLNGHNGPPGWISAKASYIIIGIK